MSSLLECAIIGGGPAGLSAALVLGRARRRVALFDEGEPRNAVTREAHGFLTRDGIAPAELRRAAHEDIRKYGNVSVHRMKVAEVANERGLFRLRTEEGERFEAKKLIVATGLKERLPAIDGLRELYGRSLFSCPYCDGWELRDQPLVVIGEQEEKAYHLAKTASQWSRNLLLCTNGSAIAEGRKRALEANGIRWNESRIRVALGTDGILNRVIFEGGEEEPRRGGFVVTEWFQGSALAESLGCRMNEKGGIETDEFGRTSVEGVFAAGDAAVISPAQLIVAAAEGSRAAMGVNGDLIHESFLPG